MRLQLSKPIFHRTVRQREVYKVSNQDLVFTHRQDFHWEGEKIEKWWVGSTNNSKWYCFSSTIINYIRNLSHNLSIIFKFNFCSFQYTSYQWTFNFNATSSNNIIRRSRIKFSITTGSVVTPTDPRVFIGIYGNPGNRLVRIGLPAWCNALGS